jgi:hypothetical protein
MLITCFDRALSTGRDWSQDWKMLDVPPSWPNDFHFPITQQHRH